MISCEAKAMPKRMAAQPHALEKVCSTIRLGYLSSSSKKEGASEKSL